MKKSPVRPNKERLAPLPFPIVTEKNLVHEWCALHRLIDELSALQQRLGTPFERPEDYDHVREVGHNIRNKLQLLQLWSDCGMLPHGKSAELELVGK